MNLSNLVRSTDPSTSVEASLSIVGQLNDLQQLVYGIVQKQGTCIDSELVEIGLSMGYAESTLRKRRSELSQMGLLELVGSRKNKRGRKELVWQVTPSQIQMF